MPNANGGQMQAPAPAPQPTHMNTGRMWFVVIAVIVIAIALVSGIELARSNSDIICTRSFQDSGSCTNGSWGPWSVTSQSIDQIACRVSYNEARTYTGLRNTILSTISVSANAHTYCNLSDDAFRRGSGTITSQFSACQIRESRTRVLSGAGSGMSCVVPTSTSTAQGTITSDTNTETTGEIDESKTVTVTGDYQLYLDMIDARFATSTLHVTPNLLRSGDTTHVIWTSDHVKSCTVVGENGDSWPKPVTVTKPVTNNNNEGDRTAAGAQDNRTNQATETATETVTEMPAGKTGDEVSSPIVQRTTYTLTCTTAIGTKLVSHATVNIIPRFQEI